MPSFQLVVRRGPKSGETFELKAQTVIIGRDSTADIIINDPEVSRNHCRLILDRSYYLQDLGSTNGTFVDGQRLGGEPVRLSNGQILQLGSNVTLLYQE
ncbi:MAG: FHA domain-containing protein, partial [Chloroflexota bacterium]